MHAIGWVEDAALLNAIDWILKVAERGDVKAESNLNYLQISNDSLGK